jgi:hemoglobin
MPHNEISEDAIRDLLDRFYTAVRCDPELGPVFARAIADDHWPAHLVNIQDFWSAVLLKSGRYKRNPLQAHREIAGISPALFTRWLALFAEACHDVLVPPLAEAIHAKAVLIGGSLQAGLLFRPAQAIEDPSAGSAARQS